MSSKTFYSFGIITIILTVALSSFTLCQIPNAGFENWTNGTPDNWTVNSTSQFPTIMQSTDAHSGSYSVEGKVVSFSGFSFAPVLTSAFPLTQRPANLSGYYKFNSVGNDTLLIVFASYKNDSGIGGGVFETSVSAGSYTQFNIPISYISGDTPDSAGITISIKPVISAHSGTTFNIDDLAFTSGATAVEDQPNQTPKKFELEQNYPNPFNPSTIIRYDIPKSVFVSLKIYNILGKEITSLVNEEKKPGEYSITFNAASLPSGIYLYMLNAGSFSETKKFVLLK